MSKSEKMNSKEQIFNNNFYGNVKGIQIQQGTSDSTQNQTNIDKFDYEEIETFIKRIEEYDDLYEKEFGELADKVRACVGNIDSMLKKRDEPSKIKNALLDLKNLAIGITGSVIASGIVANIPIF